MWLWLLLVMKWSISDGEKLLVTLSFVSSEEQDLCIWCEGVSHNKWEQSQEVTEEVLSVTWVLISTSWRWTEPAWLCLKKKLLQYTRLVYFQLLKWLYNYKCLLVCMSVGKTPFHPSSFFHQPSTIILQPSSFLLHFLTFQLFSLLEESFPFLFCYVKKKIVFDVLHLPYIHILSSILYFPF